MSFILDALKRAERERRLERPPDLSAVYEESDVSQPGRWPWFTVGLAFLAGAVAVALFLWPEGPTQKMSKSPETARAVTSPAPDRDRPPGAKVQTKMRPKSRTPSQPLRPRVKEAAVERHLKVASKKPEKAPSMTESGPPIQKKGAIDIRREPPVSEKKAPALGPSEPGTAKVPDTSPPPEVAVKETAPSGPPEQIARKRLEIPETPRPTPEERPLEVPVEAIPLLKDLPSEIQEKLGKLEINVHGYSRDPAKRLVFINMRKYHVGDRIGKDGPLLKRIIPDGVIIDYGGGKARLMLRE